MRLELLAGLVDSDGSFVRGRGVVFNVSNTQLAKDIATLAGSLGLLVKTTQVRTSIKSIGYSGLTWRVTLVGSLAQIPTLLPRKQAKDSVKHKLGRYRIKVTPVGNGEYWGFTIGGNNRFVLDDFTVTHNTTFCINLAVNMIHDNIKSDVIYYACEIDQHLAAARALCCLSGQTLDELVDGPNKFKTGVEEQIPMYTGRLLFKSYPSRGVKISDLKMHAKRAIREFGLKPKAIIIDYADTIVSELAGTDSPDYRQQGDIYTAARKMATDLNCTVIMPDRCKIDFVNRPVPNMTAFQGAFEKAGIVDVGIGLCQTEAERETGDMRYFIFLNRHGKEGVLFRGRCDIPRYRMTVDEQIEYTPEDLRESDRHKKHNGGGGGLDRKKRDSRDNVHDE